MSAAFKAQMTVTLKDGTVKPFSDFDAADNGIDISGGSLNIGHMEVAFEPNLSMGDYALPLAALKKDLPNEEWPCDSSQGGMDSCAFDYAGYKDAPNAFPMGANLGIKKVGNGCQTAEWCKAWEEFADTGTPEKRQAIADAMSTVYSGCETGTMANGVCPQPAESGAVKLEVDEVVAMKVTMRKSTGCDISQRPAVPDGVDSTGQSGTSWTSLPADHDCPWWLLATGHSDSGTPPWAIPAASNDPLSGVSIKLEDKTNCASGDCYLVDFHIPLEDANGVRNVLGSVANDYERGWQKGSFFMYDPEVKTPLPPKQSGSSGGNSGGENVGGAMATFSSGALACALMGTVVAVAMGRD